MVTFAALPAAAALAAPASAQGLPPVSLDAILAGARSCVSATSVAGIDEAKLRADNFHQATMSSNGRPVQNGLSFYARDGLLLVLGGQATMPLCTVTARIASVAEFPKLQAAFATTYGAPVRDDGKGEQIFFTTDHHILDLASTGSNERPSVRISVGPVPQETK